MGFIVGFWQKGRPLSSDKPLRKVRHCVKTRYFSYGPAHLSTLCQKLLLKVLSSLLTLLTLLAERQSLSRGGSTFLTLNLTIGWPEGRRGLCAEVLNPRVIPYESPRSIQSFILFSRERGNNSAQRLLLSLTPLGL